MTKEEAQKIADEIAESLEGCWVPVVYDRNVLYPKDDEDATEEDRWLINATSFDGLFLVGYRAWDWAKDAPYYACVDGKEISIHCNCSGDSPRAALLAAYAELKRVFQEKQEKLRGELLVLEESLSRYGVKIDD